MKIMEYENNTTNNMRDPKGNGVGNLIWWIIGLVIVIILLFFVFRGASAPAITDMSTSTATSTGTVVHQFPPASGPMSIEDYVTNNINSLSLVQPRTGGTFHVTSVDANNGSGTVTYTDGQQTYTADFTYTVDANGVPTVTAFIPNTKG